MPSIEISWDTYYRLNQVAGAFGVTLDTVIARLLRGNGGGGGPTQGSGTGADDDHPVSPPDPDGVDFEVDVTVDDPFNPPSLRHTTVYRAKVNGREVDTAKWTNVRQSLIEIALSEPAFGEPRLLRSRQMNAVKGAKSDKGYKYYPVLGISVQGQDANRAWQAAASLADALSVPVKVWFEWENRADAAYPGKRGLLTIG